MSERITLTPSQLVDNATNATERFMNLALEWLQKKNIPNDQRGALMEIFVRSCMNNLFSASVLEGCREIAEALNEYEYEEEEGE